MVRPQRDYPPYTNGLVVHATFFLVFLKQILAKKAGFIEKKCFFAEWSGGWGGGYPYTLSGPTTKKTFFMCVFPKLL